LQFPFLPIAATSDHPHRAHAATAAYAGSTGSSTSAGPDTALTGTTLASASAAALAAAPGMVDGAMTETDGTGAIEVPVTKSDGSRVKVVKNASFTVLSTTATACG
jgi:hypothetical protein